MISNQGQFSWHNLWKQNGSWHSSYIVDIKTCTFIAWEAMIAFHNKSAFTYLTRTKFNFGDTGTKTLTLNPLLIFMSGPVMTIRLRKVLLSISEQRTVQQVQDRL